MQRPNVKGPLLLLHNTYVRNVKGILKDGKLKGEYFNAVFFSAWYASEPKPFFFELFNLKTFGGGRGTNSAAMLIFCPTLLQKRKDWHWTPEWNWGGFISGKSVAGTDKNAFQKIDKMQRQSGGVAEFVIPGDVDLNKYFIGVMVEPSHFETLRKDTKIPKRYREKILTYQATKDILGNVFSKDSSKEFKRWHKNRVKKIDRNKAEKVLATLGVDTTGMNKEEILFAIGYYFDGMQEYSRESKWFIENVLMTDPRVKEDLAVQSYMRDETKL